MQNIEHVCRTLVNSFSYMGIQRLPDMPEQRDIGDVSRCRYQGFQDGRRASRKKDSRQLNKITFLSQTKARKIQKQT
jgi:hypothetical protein